MHCFMLSWIILTFQTVQKQHDALQRNYNFIDLTTPLHTKHIWSKFYRSNIHVSSALMWLFWQKFHFFSSKEAQQMSFTTGKFFPLSNTLLILTKKPSMVWSISTTIQSSCYKFKSKINNFWNTHCAHVYFWNTHCACVYFPRVKLFSLFTYLLNTFSWIKVQDFEETKWHCT